jgi:chemotaxis-related protein WspD
MLASQQGNYSVFIFRLGKQWFALPTHFLKEVTLPKQIIPIPYKTNSILLGTVNINGELRLCVSAHTLLGITPTASSNRMIVIAKEGEIWVFPVDEIEGTVHWNSKELKILPFTPSRSIQNYLAGEMKTESKEIYLFDEELLFSALQRSLT